MTARGSGRAYVAALTIAEAIAIAGVAVAFAIVDRNPAAGAVPIIAAGIGEGVLLGAAQARFGTGLTGRAWLFVALTALGAALGYGGMHVVSGGAGAGAAAGTEPPLWITLLGGMFLGLGMGVLMGILQVPALARAVSGMAWIARTALGWAPAMAAIMLAASLAQPGQSLWQIALMGALGGAAAGFCVARATAPAVPGLDHGR